jgi:flavodoxin
MRRQPLTNSITPGRHTMGTEIYYFSGTGNSLHVAKELQARIPETRLIPIVSLLHRDAVKASAETVGLVFPQYASSTPKLVDRFIGKLDLAATKYIFAIVTRGGTTCYAFDQADKLLKKKGRKEARRLLCPDNAQWQRSTHGGVCGQYNGGKDSQVGIRNAGKARFDPRNHRNSEGKSGRESRWHSASPNLPQAFYAHY